MAFDPRLLFRTRDGRIVQRYQVAEDGVVHGRVDGAGWLWWRADGTHVRGSHLDLVNVGEPASDAKAFDLDELLRLERAATPGPWENSCFQVYGRVGRQKVKVAHSGMGQRPPSEAQESEDNAALIAAARNAIPRLPAYIAQQRAEARREALEEAAKIASEWMDDSVPDRIRTLIDKDTTP